MLDICNFAFTPNKNYLLLQNMEKKHYAIEPEIGKQLIEWGLRNRPQGMKGAWKSQRAQLRLVCIELLEIAEKHEKKYQPVIQRSFKEENEQ